MKLVAWVDTIPKDFPAGIVGDVTPFSAMPVLYIAYLVRCEIDIRILLWFKVAVVTVIIIGNKYMVIF